MNIFSRFFLSWLGAFVGSCAVDWLFRDLSRPDVSLYLFRQMLIEGSACFAIQVLISLYYIEKRLHLFEKPQRHSAGAGQPSA